MKRVIFLYEYYYFFEIKIRDNPIKKKLITFAKKYIMLEKGYKLFNEEEK